MAQQRITGRRYRVTGLVQGVGFRPTVWRLATEIGLSGHVLNDAAGVEIEAFGPVADLVRFEDLIRAEAPPLARIDRVTWEEIGANAPGGDFVICESRPGEAATGVVPDAAVCPACLDDIFTEGNRRKGYAFTNCTQCGPRLSIVRAIPYDRANTSMSAFTMCPACGAEYADPRDRRFHAQPNACPVCGPRLWFEDGSGGVHEDDALDHAAALLRSGRIVAIKGIGGFHLACDATDEAAVARLRARKQRPAKPLAVMVRDIEMARAFAEIDAPEADLLMSAPAPIVLARKREETALAASVAPRQDRIGLMLPYTPLHALLMAKLTGPLVMTSGNRSDEPQATVNDDARSRLTGIADGWLMHDREIVNRLDDSVVRVDARSVQILRRARGFAPAPVRLHSAFSVPKRILAMGGELKSTVCLLADGQAILSQHIGDLEEAATFADYRHALDLYRTLFDFRPDAIAVDLHPDYVSTRYGRTLAAELGVPVIAVQHHHAHLAACLAENGVASDEPALGIVLDGLGLGQTQGKWEPVSRPDLRGAENPAVLRDPATGRETPGNDGSVWGGEILLGDCSGFRRLAHFLPVAMPGGNAAAREPWRNLAAHLRAAFGRDWRAVVADHRLLAETDPAKLRIVDQMMDRGVNAPLASSAGRLFDAVAAALGVCPTRQEFEGQAGMALEARAAPHLNDAHPYPSDHATIDGRTVLSWRPLWEALLDDLAAGTGAGLIAARFHLGLIDALTQIVVALAAGEGIKRVALSGGVMTNAILCDGLCASLSSAGLIPIVHSKVPANDGGLALGQAAIAACVSS